MSIAIEATPMNPDGAVHPIDVTVTAVRPAADGTNLYELTRPDGAQLPAAEPGAHIDLHLPNGMTRQYRSWFPVRFLAATRLVSSGTPTAAAPHATFSKK